MSDLAVERFAPRASSDHDFFQFILFAIWGGVIAGFVPDSLEHVTGKHVPYALIVHIHALSYVAWIGLLSAQMTLVRTGRTALHKRLGMASVFMIPWMTIVGPWAFLVMDWREFGTPDGDSAFLILPVLSVLSFAAVTTVGVIKRADSALHKRLMLLGTVLLADAGFARWIGPFLRPYLHRMLGESPLVFHIPQFIGSNVLMAAMLAHDYFSRRRLSSGLVIAVAFAVAVQVLITYIYKLPAWTPFVTHLLGH